MHNFSDGKPWIATEADCDALWHGIPHGNSFRCRFCDYRFVPGDKVRWQYTNDVAGAGGNPLVCEKCDGTKTEIVEKMKDLHKGADVIRAERNALREENEDLKFQLKSVTEVINGSTAMAHLDVYRNIDWKLGEEAKQELAILRTKLKEIRDFLLECSHGPSKDSNHTSLLEWVKTRSSHLLKGIPE